MLYRYAELIDAGDFDGVGALLARSTFGGSGPQGVSGADNIAKLFAATTRRYPEHGNTPRTRHLVLNPHRRAERRRNGGLPLHLLRHAGHRDRADTAHRRRPLLRQFGRDDGGWYFTERKVEIQMIGDVSAHLMVDPRSFDG